MVQIILLYYVCIPKAKEIFKKECEWPSIYFSDKM